jgi:aspartyl-tRNA(Asn)/glutamyl-tRNA(Gln) amidotransferase subunit C
MSSQLTRDEVLRIAALAHLQLTDAEIDLFSTQLTAILGYAETVRQADTSGVPPTSHPLETQTAWRDDVPVASLDREPVLREAPSAAPDAGLFKVPKVL